MGIFSFSCPKNRFEQLLKKGHKQLSNGNHHESFAFAQMALEQTRKPEQIAKSYLLMAESLKQAGGQSVTLRQPLPDHAIPPDFRGPIRQAHYFMLMQLASFWWGKAGKQDQVIATLYAVAAEYMRRGDAGNAINFFLRCSEEAKKARDKHTFANVMGELGDIALAAGMYKEALKYTWNAYVIFEKEHSPQRQITDEVMKEIENSIGHKESREMLAEVKRQPLLY